ncbi:MAG: hypothetical protein MUE85_00405 [Microscillaceae bacterium]|jgi:hypothetical protein|nr:hypothetical protein [Microscillaceae bacterium]
MDFNTIKYELQNIIRGNGQTSQRSTLQAVAYYLSRSQSASSQIEDSKQYKIKEIEFLNSLLKSKELWLSAPDPNTYLTEGAEQKVYLVSDFRNVLKMNSGVFYLSWLDYLHSLLLHNFFFPHTAYDFLGFCQDTEEIFAVVKQPYIKTTEATNPDLVKEFLENNGFVNQKNQDYEHKDLGIILEDLHDENVLTYNDTLFFIDTVFYLKDSFWESGN